MFDLNINYQSDLRRKITENYRSDETKCVNELLRYVSFSEQFVTDAKSIARNLVTKTRNSRINANGIDNLMQEFKLSTLEGVALMCLAESLLRIPDSETQNKLISDKVAKAKWSKHTKTESLFVNATSWGLMLTGKLMKVNSNEKTLSSMLYKVLAKGGEPIIRKAMTIAVRLMGQQFVMGETIEEALKKSHDKECLGYRFSYDMLGEAALTEDDATSYMQSYIDAIHAIGKNKSSPNVYKDAGISVKLSAIHPRYTRNKYLRVMQELYPRLKQLFMLAKEYNISLFIDAEESERLDLSLDLLDKIVHDNDLAGFNGIGFVIQAYQKRAIYVVDYVANLALQTNKKIMIRLVKGAYWDNEIKKSQVEGYNDYPVFTRKFYTDLSFLACAKKMIEYKDNVYPLFATHNALSLAFIYKMAEGIQYEFQCLYGMGETLYDNAVGVNALNVPCRVYAPVGTYKTLLAYLVRRLLENGANSSFVHQLVDINIPIDNLLINPIDLAKKANKMPNPNFNRPGLIYPNSRINSAGLDLSDEISLSKLQLDLNLANSKTHKAHPLIPGVNYEGREYKNVLNPANHEDIIGSTTKANLEDMELAIKNSLVGFEMWSKVIPSERSDILFKMADLLESHSINLLNLLIREAGKSLTNAISEIREAVDFCRYYATQVKLEFNNDSHKPIGPFVCISPWNFPLAIFLGEVSSVLAAGNSVIAKPSDQTILIAFYVIELLHQVGVPKDALQFVPGSGSIIGNALTKDPRIKGVVFTGSTAVAQTINQNLYQTSKDSILIAETGGQNTMIVDSSSLPEQVVTDVISSAFDSAGQRCSALRVLYLQADIADKVINMLKGAMDELLIGKPTLFATDIGPVIDKNSQKSLLEHIENMKLKARMFYQAELSPDCNNGTFVPPTFFEIGNISELKHEVFGPILHIIRFSADELEKVITEINSTGFGLTQGLHSRIDDVAIKVYENVKAGNIYINRNMVGAVVGVQPFGGEGLSGTGPKAGGMFYLYRLINTTKEPNFNYILRNFEFKKLQVFLSNLNNLDFTHNELEELNLFVLDAQANSLITKQIELTSPTGERNFMFFAPRGHVACFANDKLTYAKQIICALATDNQVYLQNSEISQLFINKIPNLINIFDDVSQVPILNVAMFSANYEQTLSKLQLISKREGNLVVPILENIDYLLHYNLHLLTTERTVSINITATGGNVQLMSMVDNV